MFMGRVSAAPNGSFTSRSIKMSNSSPGATNVTYQVTFNVSSDYTAEGIAIEFCNDSPLDKDTCTATAGVNTPDGDTVGGGGIEVAITEAGWTEHANSDDTTWIFTHAGDAWDDATPETITFTGVTNPTDVDSAGTFYARFYSYDLAAEAAGYTTADPDVVGARQDFGGFALSTASILHITAKVQERLEFCVYIQTGSCGTGGTSVLLGDANGVLDDTADHNNAETTFSLKTNATGGAIVRLKTLSANNTLTSGSNTITAMAAAAATSIGDEQFGLCVAATSPIAADAAYVGTGGGGTCASDLTSNDGYSGDAWFYLDTASTGSTYGDEIANTGGAALDTQTARLNFLGNIDVLTEAGIYTVDMSLIATGTF
jgi:hypothetical protein